MGVRNLEWIFEVLSSVEEDARVAQFALVDIKDELSRLIRDIRELKEEVQAEFENE